MPMELWDFINYMTLFGTFSNTKKSESLKQDKLTWEATKFMCMTQNSDLRVYSIIYSISYFVRLSEFVSFV